MTTRRGRVACRFPRKDQSSAVDFFPFWNEVFSARTGQLKIWGIAFGEGFVFGVTCLSDLCHLCELCIYLASIHHEASCPFKLMESQTRTTRDMPRYGLWRKRAESLIVEQKRQLCAESRRLGISLAFALDELQGLGLREKSAEIWRTTRCNDTMIHDKWAQSGNQATLEADHNQIRNTSNTKNWPMGSHGAYPAYPIPQDCIWRKPTQRNGDDMRVLRSPIQALQSRFVSVMRRLGFSSF